MSHLRVFGSKCFYVVPKNKHKKLDPRCREVIMVGYSSQSKGYKLWDPDSRTFVYPDSRTLAVSRDVTCDESVNSKIEEINVTDSSNRDSTIPASSNNDDTTTSEMAMTIKGEKQTVSPLPLRLKTDQFSPLADRIERPDHLANGGNRKAVLLQAFTRLKHVSSRNRTRNPPLQIR